jgi:hypothetical protein
MIERSRCSPSSGWTAWMRRTASRRREVTVLRVRSVVLAPRDRERPVSPDARRSSATRAVRWLSRCCARRCRGRRGRRRGPGRVRQGVVGRRRGRWHRGGFLRQARRGWLPRVPGRARRCRVERAVCAGRPGPWHRGGGRRCSGSGCARVRRRDTVQRSARPVMRAAGCRDRGQSGEYAGEAELGGELRGASCMEIVGAEGGEFQVGFGFPGSCAQPAGGSRYRLLTTGGLFPIERGHSSASSAASISSNRRVRII